MTEEEFLTLTLPERIRWCHGPDGPRGKLSHDRFAKILGTSRQTVISWENGTSEPRDYREKLAEFSGFPEAAFSRRSAEAPSAVAVAARLATLEAKLEEVVELMTEGLDRIAGAIARLEQQRPGGGAQRHTGGHS